MAAMPADQRRTDWFDDVLKKQSLSFSELTDIVVESKLFSVDQLWQEAKASCGRRDFAVRDLRRCGLSSSQRMLGHLTQLAQCGGNVSSVEDTPYSTGNSYGGLEMVGYPKSPWVSIVKWSNFGWFGVPLWLRKPPCRRSWRNPLGPEVLADFRWRRRKTQQTTWVCWKLGCTPTIAILVR